MVQFLGSWVDPELRKWIFNLLHDILIVKESESPSSIPPGKGKKGRDILNFRSSNTDLTQRKVMD